MAVSESPEDTPPAILFSAAGVVCSFDGVENPSKLHTTLRQLWISRLFLEALPPNLRKGFAPLDPSSAILSGKTAQNRQYERCRRAISCRGSG